jgi:hypothetical protein
MADKNRQQLYFLLKKLKASIEDDNEFATLVSYAILDSLIDFHTRSGATEEISFEEIKIVYLGLEKALEPCINGQCYRVVCSMKVRVDPLIRQGSVPAAADSSRLLISLLQAVAGRRGNAEDILRRNGLILAQEILSRGPLFHKMDMLRRDYRDISTCFGKK